MTSHNLDIGGKYVVTYELRSDPRRAPKFATRTFTVADTFTTSGKVYYYLRPVRGNRVCVAASEITEAVPA